MNSTIKQPSAWIPMALSFAALVIVLAHAAIFGIVYEADEGSAAHLFQILIGVQVPIVAFFAIKWLPRNPKEALEVIALQCGAALLAFASVFFLTH